MQCVPSYVPHSRVAESGEMKTNWGKWREMKRKLGEIGGNWLSTSTRWSSAVKYLPLRQLSQRLQQRLELVVCSASFSSWNKQDDYLENDTIWNRYGGVSGNLIHLRTRERERDDYPSKISSPLRANVIASLWPLWLHWGSTVLRECSEKTLWRWM